MDVMPVLKWAVEHNASDVHLQAGLPPRLRIAGILRAINQPPLSDEDVRAFVTSIAPKRMQDNLDDRLIKGMDFSYSCPGLSRFRCSGYASLGTSGISMRVIKSKILSVAELNLPPVISEIAMSGRGLTLITGTTG